MTAAPPTATGTWIRLWEPEDYPMLAAWWQAHGWPPVPREVLPRLGVIALRGLSPLAAGWLYMDNSTPVAMLEWLVANPEAPPRSTVAGLVAIIGFLKEEAKALDYSAILATCRQPGLSRLLCKAGFHVTDKSVIHHMLTL